MLEPKRTLSHRKELCYRFSCFQHGVNKVITVSGSSLNAARRDADPQIDAMLLVIKQELYCGDVIVNEEEIVNG
jgi:hypothetical protein